MQHSAYLMHGSAVALVHFVKLINAADAFISQRKSATFQHLHIQHRTCQLFAYKNATDRYKL